MAGKSPENRRFRVLLIGCGQLGSRHLQALSSLPQIGEIEVVDPRPQALALGRERLGEVPDRAPSTEIRWLSSIEQVAQSGDLCVLATQANVRGQLVHQIVERLDYSSFLLEKVVAESVRDYEELMSFSKANGLSVWVNCKSRAQFAHKRAKAHLDPNQPISLTAFGGSHGLANNGVHIADLFCFYDESTFLEPDEIEIDPILHPSKRGNDLYDLSGTLRGHSSKGSSFTISFAPNHMGPVLSVIKSPKYEASINDDTKCFYERREETGWRWERVPYLSNIYVSYMTRGFASDILATGQCELPTLEACYPAHRFILDALLPHFNNLLGVDAERCPVT